MVNLSEELEWSEKVKWLKENELWDSTMEKAQLERRYIVFSQMQFGDCVWMDQKEYYKDLVHLEHGFAAFQNDIGLVEAYPFSMIVRNGPPIRQKPIQYNKEQRQWIKEQALELEEKGIIRPAEPGASLHRVVLVSGREDRPGQSGQTYRLCTDFRAINRRTLTESFPAPDLQDCMRRVASALVFSSIDLKSGFHNIPVAKEDQKYLGFITQDGSWQYQRLQFGLNNAPAHFQKVIVSVIDHGDCQVVIYLDDIVVYGSCARKVWKETCLVLSRLVAAGFMINTRKSTMLVSELKMLGYHVKAGTIRPSYAQLSAKVEAGFTPKTKKDIQRIYGLLSYFRTFIGNFAQLAQPISQLLKGNGPLVWTPKHDAVIQRVLEQLVVHAGLKLPQPLKPFVLEACATSQGYGGVLLQKGEDGKLAPIGCVSTLKQRVTNSEVEATLAAVVYCLRRFHNIIQIAPLIEVHSSTAGLQQLVKQTNVGARLGQMIAEVQAYPVAFKHMPVVQQKVKNALALPEEEYDDASGVVIQSQAFSRTVKKYKGIPVEVTFDGAYAEGIGTTGFTIRNRTGGVWETGEFDVGLTSNHAEFLAALHALQRIVELRLHKQHDYISVKGDSQLVLNYLNRVWQCKQPHLADVFDELQGLIRKHKLKAMFQWIPRSENSAADTIARKALLERRKVEVYTPSEGVPVDVVTATTERRTRKGQGQQGHTSRRKQVSKGLLLQVSEDDEHELREVQVRRIKRPRGRPRKLLPIDIRKKPAFRVQPVTYQCLSCSTQENTPSVYLPLYCDQCYRRLMLEGHNDATEDLPLIYFLWFGSHLPGICNETARRVLDMAKMFKLDYDNKRATHYQLLARQGDNWKLVPAKERREALIAEFHDTHGHRNGQAVFTELNKTFWWPTLRADCVRYVATCVVCSNERVKFKKQLPLKPCAQPSQPLEGWSMDLITDLPMSPEGHVFVLVCVDVFSKWVELYPLKTKEAAEIANVLWQEFLPRYGRPRWIRVDQGLEFKGDLSALTSYLGVTMRTASSGYPRSNGQAERIIRIVKSCFRKYVDSVSGSQWFDWLPEILYGLRFCTSRSHGHTPFFMVYKQEGRHITHPLDLEVVPMDITNTEQSEDTVTKALLSQWAALQPKLLAARAVYQDKMKKYHDEVTPRLEPTFQPGDRVVRRQRRVGKLLPKVEGPFTFVRYTSSPSVAVITDGIEEIRVHLSHLAEA